MSYESGDKLSDSILLRLIYMWQETREVFDELIAILGRGGLDIIDHIDVTPMGLQPPSSPTPGSGGSSVIDSDIFIPLFWPSSHMGGAARPFSFDELSVGTRRLIRIVTFTLFDGRSLMLMEQPEDSIHVGLLRKLIDQLRTYSFNSQMILTTHSTDLLDILEPEEILLASAPGGATQVRTLTLYEIDRAKAFLSDKGSLSDFLEPIDDL